MLNSGGLCGTEIEIVLFLKIVLFLEHKKLYRKDGKLTAQPPTWEYDEDGKGAIVENTVRSKFNVKNLM